MKPARFDYIAPKTLAAAVDALAASNGEGKLLAGSRDPERVYLEQIRPEKIRLQLEYVKSQSLANDMRILLATFKVLLFGRPTSNGSSGVKP